MADVQIGILQPANNQIFIGIEAENIAFRGQVDPNAPQPLFFKWYSSLNKPEGITGPEDAHKASLNKKNVDNPLNFAKPLDIGSHIITFTAKDRESDALTEIKLVQNAGMAGGPEDADSPCIIHVFFSKILVPQAETPVPRFSRDSSGNVVVIFEAQAPLKWGKPDGAMDEEYHKINRIQYRVRFEPAVTSTPVKLPNFAIAAKEFVFISPEEESDVPKIRYSGKLVKNALSPGMYKFVLRVEDQSDSRLGHEDSVNVVVE
ncbi:MAG: hypothetical protein ACE5I1_13340 [bacterium]